MSQPKETIAIIGTGNFGIALGKRLHHFGFNVIYGSRNPNLNYVKECFVEEQAKEIGDRVSVTSIENAVTRSDGVVFLAVKDENHSFVSDILNKLTLNLKRKRLIDPSNPWQLDKSMISNAEMLSAMVKNPMIDIVKGFNALSAYSMEEESEQKQTVALAGDSDEAKEQLTKLCNRIGFQAYDAGSLRGGSYRVEQANGETFAGWLVPSIITLLFVTFNFVWIFFWYFCFPKKPQSFDAYLKSFTLMAHLNKVLGFSAIHLLSFVYLPSVVAGVYQLWHGTKYQRFPAYLNAWLRMRKQLGLLTFLVATLHMLLSVFIATPAYLDTWYRPMTGNGQSITMMTWNGELSIITGVVAYVLMALVALTSVNSIAASLNWSEWRFVQTNIGLACLGISLLHDAIMYSRIIIERDLHHYDQLYIVTRVKMIALFVPFIVFGPISTRIQKIIDGQIVSTLKKEQ